MEGYKRALHGICEADNKLIHALQMKAEREAALLEKEAAKQQAAYLHKAIEGRCLDCLLLHHGKIAQIK